MKRKRKVREPNLLKEKETRKAPEQHTIKLFLKADIKTLEAFRDDCANQAKLLGLVNGKDLRPIFTKLARKITIWLEDL